MTIRRVHHEVSRRRGTVLIMVVGVLSMLFIVGATLLIVARFERQTAKTVAAGRNLEGAAIALAEPSLAQLREDVVGKDAGPYNAAWSATETSQLEDFADFPGRSSNAFLSGDLLLSSIEPYYNATDRNWRLFAMSWPQDFVPAGGSGPSNHVQISSWNADPLLRVSPLTGGPRRDAAGDGARDSSNQAGSVGLSGNMELFLRVIPHGGMVLLDPMTHPSLLSQVIHPLDAPYHNEPWRLWETANALVITENDEGLLRRRLMLPGYLGWHPSGRELKVSDLPANDMRNKLQVTLGYEAPVGADANFKNLTPHFWPADEDQVRGDLRWWEQRVTPGPALTNRTGDPGGSYSAPRDLYDRRRLVTTANSDDILRPYRDEERLATYSGYRGQDDPAAPVGYEERQRFHYIVNPQSAADPPNTLAWDLDPVSGGPLHYGRLVGDPDDATSGSIALHFNVPGLRTQFSLRDALDPLWNSTTERFVGGVSYRRAMQLTAYYLAMLQRTSVPEGRRLQTAAQLAVNTLDFADNGDSDGDGIADVLDRACFFVWPPATDPNVWPQTPLPPSTEFAVQALGVEKQPYLTEAYAKQVIGTMENPRNPGTYDMWDDDPGNLPLQSIYAVELYNPYPGDLDVTTYELQVVGGTTSAAKVTIPLATVPNFGGVMPAYGYIVFANQDPGVGTVNTDVFLASTLAIEDGDRIRLVRTEAGIAQLTPTGVLPAPPGLKVVVDQLAPVGLGAPNGFWAEAATTNISQVNTDFPPPTDKFDQLVRDSSLQRHKEPALTPPVHWHFTLSRQMLLPPRAYEVGDGVNDPPLTNEKGRPAQHNLLGTDPMKAAFGPGLRIGNQELVAKEFKGIEFLDFQPFTGADWVTLSLPDQLPIAPFPVVTADRGVDPRTGGCVAFPTTGTMLMVTRYGHDVEDPSLPFTVAATRQWNNSSQELDRAGLATLDNGHMPVFDGSQATSDLAAEQGRLDVPWGQLVFDYFTALPLEELVRKYDLKTMGFTALTTPGIDPESVRMVNLNNADYRRVYGLDNPGDGQPAPFFTYYSPVVAAAGAPSPLGPKVNGRININIGPWWVLDGLPLLPDGEVGSSNAIPTNSRYPLAGLPLAELESGRLDPLDATFTGRYDQAGVTFLDLLVDEVADGPPVGLPSASPTLAKYMVSYRENRDVTNPTSGNVEADAGRGAGPPGFVTQGALCDLMGRVRIPTIRIDGTNVTNQTLGQLRGYAILPGGSDPVNDDRPYSYVGYLQLLAPVVRMQDWATVRNHVYTLYSVVGDTSTEPPLWLRSQVTVDRTRCLYSQDLPLRIAETPPTGYYNVVGD